MFFCIKMFVSGMLFGRTRAWSVTIGHVEELGPGSASLLLSLWHLFLLELGTTACAPLMPSLPGHPADPGKADALFHSLSIFATPSIASAVHCLAAEP